MPQHKHFFISYGRKESLAFAGRLHQWLALNGHEAWFDKVNIPSGDDYQERINAGIRDAQNFLFVMAPHSLTSPYCYAELEYALSLGKRIFPVMHIEESPEQIEGYTDKQREVRGKTFAVVGKRDWLMAREQLGNLDELRSWQTSYENSWLKHEEKEYLENWQCPIVWQSIDKLEEAGEKLLQMASRHGRHVEQHTELLNLAYEWDKSGRPTNGVLVGHERTEAERWLTTEFRGELPPCQAIPLQAQYVVASKKNAQNLMTEAFLCYATPNKEVTVAVQNALEMRGVSTWIHFHDIERAQDYLPKIKQGIEEADNFLFFLSKESLASEWCMRELEYAFELNKRIIPLKIGNYDADMLADSTDAMRRVLTLQHIDFTDNEEGKVDEIGKTDFDRDIDDISREMSRDEDYYGQHKILLSQALRWEKDPLPAYLLRGHNLENALAWLRQNRGRRRDASRLDNHAPTALHERFIKESEQQRGLHPSELFISYSRKDADFARQLNRRLQAEGRITWFDQESIASGVDFDQAIFEGIGNADNFLFIISPDSVASDFCVDELSHAANLGKRYIPILLEESGEYAKKLPEAYANTQWIDFAGKGFEKGVQDLLILLDTDRDHVRGHAEWQRRALDWEASNRGSGHLLNAAACAQAEAWLDDARPAGNSDGRVKEPPPTALQQDFVKKSREAIRLAEKKLRTRLRNAQIAIGVAVLLMLVAAGAGWVATDKAEEAEIEKTNALVAKQEADSAKILAEEKAREAFMSDSLAQIDKKNALTAKQEADSAKTLAQEKEKEAELQLAKVLEANKGTVKLLLANARKKRDEMAYGEAIGILDNAGQIGVLKEEIAKEYVEFIFYYAMTDSSELVVDLLSHYGGLLKEKQPAPPKGIESLAKRYQAVNKYIGQIADEAAAKKLGQTYFPQMVDVKGGTMGLGGNKSYKVTLSDYRMAQSEVTVGQYLLFCEATKKEPPQEPSFKWRQQDPVVNVEWYDATAYCNYVSEVLALETVYDLDGDDIKVNWGANGLRLPTEAEWEYAARGGQKQKPTTYAGSNKVDSVAWYRSNTNRTGPRPVMTKKPNELGLYDMSGNVWEWCWDWYGGYPEESQENPKGGEEGSYRVFRGGSWYDYAGGAGVSDRFRSYPSRRHSGIGFRVGASAP